MTDNTKNGVIKQKLPPGFHLEASRTLGGISITVGGIVGIKELSEDIVILGTHSGRIIVSGKRLRVMIYEGGNAEVSGKAEEIKFEYGKT